MATLEEYFKDDTDNDLITLANMAEEKYAIVRSLQNDDIIPSVPPYVRWEDIEPSNFDFLDYDEVIDLKEDQEVRSERMELIPEDRRIKIIDYQLLNAPCKFVTSERTSENIDNSQIGNEVVQYGRGFADYDDGATGSVQDGEGRHSKIRQPLFTVTRSFSRYYTHFKTNGTRYLIKIADPDEKINPLRWVSDILNGIIDYYKENSSININPWDRIGMTLINTSCDGEPIFVALRRADQLDADVVLDQIMIIFESNKEFFLNGNLSIHFDHVRMPNGSGRVSKKLGESNQEFIQKKYSFIKYANPKNKFPRDNYCLPYAIVLAKAYVDKDKKLRRYINSISTLRNAAELLCVKANVRMALLRKGCSLDEVKKFQAVLPEYQIVIFLGLNMTTNKKDTYTDLSFYSDKKLNILLENNHYTAMKSPQGCFASSFICPDCHKRSRSSRSHKNCIYTCPCCLSRPPCQLTEYSDRLKCFDCLRSFRGSMCYDNHKRKTKKVKYSVCDRIKICPICRVRYHVEGEGSHFCCVNYCVTSEKNEAEGHQCHMPLYTTKRDDDCNILYVQYDFETQQDTLLNEEDSSKSTFVAKFKHIPNLCVVQIFCLSCKDIDDISKPCESCGKREFIFMDNDPVESLLKFLASKANEKEEVVGEVEFDQYGLPKDIPVRNKFKKVIAMAHNSSGFDGQFILSYIYNSDRFPDPRVIMKGTRVLQISLGHRVIFLDTLNYFQQPLSKLPELFGIEGSKGFYPHLWNTADKINEIGPLPDKSFYCPGSMSKEVRGEFDEWYDQMPADYVFNNKEELIAYCRQDVNILRRACVKFLNDFWESNKIDPFLDGCTIAGSCNKVFRSNYLHADVIGIIPTNGYRFIDNQSKIALQWLSLVELQTAVKIQHAGRGREKLITGIGRVDGFIDGSTFDPPRKDIILEFLGCYFHGCETCFPIQYFGQKLKETTINYTEPPHPENDSDERNQTMFMRREKTEERLKNIRDLGYDLVVMKECEFRRQMKMNPEIKLLLKDLPIIINETLDPRDAFYGGRTDANNFYFKSDDKTKMIYIDIVSLYPYIQKYSKSVVNHPTIHVGDDCQSLPWQQMDGLMKVTVSPPRGLHFPVLPTKMHNLLMFHLCNTCAKTLNKNRCEHTVEERSFTGTYVIDEVKLAVRHGYEIVKIYEIWEYKVTQYDPVSKTGGLFTRYINHFLKIKASASGFPKSCKTPEDEARYIKEFYDREGVLLDPNQVKKNPSLRQMSKIQLNSFWGRFGMRPDLVRTVVIKSYNDLVLKVMDPKIDIQSIVTVNDKTILLNYRELEAARKPNNTTNVAIAAFVTAYARMELYKYLDMLGPERVWYYDTDSLFISVKDGDTIPEIGSFLGQMTDELEKDYGSGTYIDEFVTGSAKNYAFIAYTPSTKKYNTVVKVKGVTLNYNNSEILNFDLIKSFVLEDEDEKLELYTNSIRRTITADVYSTRVKKTYQVIYTKRQKTTTKYGSIPYGF